MFINNTGNQSKLSKWKKFWGNSKVERLIVQSLFFGTVIAMALWVALKILVFNQ
jgi:hypothetical protein